MYKNLEVKEVRGFNFEEGLFLGEHGTTDSQNKYNSFLKCN